MRSRVADPLLRRSAREVMGRALARSTVAMPAPDPAIRWLPC